MNKTLGDALPEQIKRVSELVSLYKTVPYGNLAAALMQRDIETAHKAMMEGDLPAMIDAYKALEEWEYE